MAITNPTKYVSVQRLGRFKAKADAEYATKQELQEAQVSSMLHIYVDKNTMHLKGTPTSEGTFSVRSGHLILLRTNT
jgi:hypothetical protein